MSLTKFLTCSIISIESTFFDFWINSWTCKIMYSLIYAEDSEFKIIKLGKTLVNASNCSNWLDKPFETGKNKTYSFFSKSLLSSSSTMPRGIVLVLY